MKDIYASDASSSRNPSRNTSRSPTSSPAKQSRNIRGKSPEKASKVHLAATNIDVNHDLTCHHRGTPILLTKVLKKRLKQHCTISHHAKDAQRLHKLLFHGSNVTLRQVEEVFEVGQDNCILLHCLGHQLYPNHPDHLHGFIFFSDPDCIGSIAKVYLKLMGSTTRGGGTLLLDNMEKYLLKRVVDLNVEQIEITAIAIDRQETKQFYKARGFTRPNQKSLTFVKKISCGKRKDEAEVTDLGPLF